MSVFISNRITALNGGRPPVVYSEPFVGGGSVALSIALRTSLAKVKSKCTIWLNDSDPWVAAFWRAVSDENESLYKALQDKISRPVNIDVFNRRRDLFRPGEFPRKSCEAIDAAFNAIFFNRTTFSGILSSGPIGGEGQVGDSKIDCRWNVDRLLTDLDAARRVLVGRTKVHCRDWRTELSKIPSDSFIYLDPPYYKAGSALYPQSWEPSDHEQLRDSVRARRPRSWLMSYDNHPFIQKLYKGFAIEPLAHYRSMGGRSKAPRPKDSSELLIYTGKFKPEIIARNIELFA